MRKWIYEALESPDADSRVRRVTSSFVSILILANVFAVILESMQPLKAEYGPAFRVFDTISVAIFTVEYLLRLWVITRTPQFRGAILGRVKYVFTPLAMIDLVAILPYYIAFTATDLRVMRLMRLFRIFRIFKFGRYSEAFRAVGLVFWEKRRELTATTTVLGACLIVAATLMYEAERLAQPDQFGSVPDSLWWAIVTLTTVGYGDMLPVTALGKVLGSLIAVLGIGMIALPTGIIGAGFVEMIGKREERTQSCPHCGKVIAANR